MHLLRCSQLPLSSSTLPAEAIDLMQPSIAAHSEENRSLPDLAP